MDRVEGSQRRLGKRPRAGEEGSIERPQRERVDQLASAFQQQVERGGVRVEDRHGSQRSPRMSSSARLNARGSPDSSNGSSRPRLGNRPIATPARPRRG